MSKALTYKEAETIIQACAISGAQFPSFKWFMGKRRDYGWRPIIDAATDLVGFREDFLEALAADYEEHTT